MNAPLGGAYLPMGALPMTSVITRVRYGSRPKAIVHRRASGLGVKVPLAAVAGYVAQAVGRSGIGAGVLLAGQLLHQPRRSRGGEPVFVHPAPQWYPPY